MNIGDVATAELKVTEKDLASEVGLEAADQYPRVFATARLVALMEVASSRLLRPVLKEGELSVGVHINIVHSAATPVGGTVIATATFSGREGKLYVFDVIAADDGGEIGRGTHKRAIVSSERLLAGALKRTHL